MTKGSHATRGGWEPTRCSYGSDCLFGGRLVLTGPHALWFHLDDQTHQPTGFHLDCWRHHNHIRACG
jgi:hypothetical protein